jgi:hypothetical protein
VIIDSKLKQNPVGALVAAVALAMLVLPAEAQQKAPEKAAPAAKAPKAKSVCNAISEEAACKADATCSWVAALVDKTGKQKRKAYCRTKPKPPAKKAAEPAKK